MNRNGIKNAIFKNWLDTRPKMETHEPNVYPTIWGGVSRGFWTLFLDLGAQSAIFLHVKMGTFGESACFQVPKNGTLGAKTKKRRPFFKPIDPQNGGRDIGFECLPLFGGFLANLLI